MVALTVETEVKADLEKAWRTWTDPVHITHWCNASDDWHAPYAENDLRKGGKFKTTMASKDGSLSFDFEGVYTNIAEMKLIEYSIPDGRKVKISFTKKGERVKITEIFDPETQNPPEAQRAGWQAILDNYKKYTEAQKS